ncbi:hypothetical protein BH23CHL5_BH23CHL5_00640 [soil metagenome]
MLVNVLILSITALVVLLVVGDHRRQAQSVATEYQGSTGHPVAHSGRKLRRISPYLRSEIAWHRSTWGRCWGVGFSLHL